MRTPEQKAKHAVYMRAYYSKVKETWQARIREKLANETPEEREERRQKRRLSYEKRKAKINASRRIYREANKRKIKAQKRRSDIRCKARVIQYQRAWEKKNRSRSNEKNRRKRLELKLAAVAAYGGRCVCCGEADLMFLTIDHVNNDGAVARRIGIHGSGAKMYAWLRRNGWPHGFQVLCWNCNMAKAVYGRCPHLERAEKAAV